MTTSAGVACIIKFDFDDTGHRCYGSELRELKCEGIFFLSIAQAGLPDQHSQLNVLDVVYLCSSLTSMAWRGRVSVGCGWFGMSRGWAWSKRHRISGERSSESRTWCFLLHQLTGVLRHINADRAARLYHELNAEHKVVNSGIHAWAGDKDRRRDLDVGFHIF